MKFKFRAIKNGDGKYDGIRESNDKFTLYEELKAEGDTLISAFEITKPKFDITLPFINSVSEHQKIIFARNLGSMVNAGLSLTKGLNILEKQITNKRFKGIIVTLEAEIKKGKSLSAACSSYPDVFPKLFISMVKAGEESGKLSESLQLVANQMDGNYKLKKKIQGAMIYPGVLLSAMLAIGILMLIFVVPSITATFKDLNVQLPLLTRILLDSSNFLENNILLSLSVIVLIFFIFYIGFNSKKGKRFFDFIARTISSLLSSGVPYTESISITRDVIQNSFYKDILSVAMETVEKGGAISSVFMENTKLCPVFVAEMAVVGEETGRLPQMFLEVAVYYEDSVDQKTKDMSAIIEPVLIIVMGCAVGFFALAIIKPIYSLTSVIS